MADVIGFIISAKNEASKVLREVNKDLATLEKKNSSAGGLEKFATGLTAVAAAGAGVIVLKEAAEAAAELSMEGAKFERLSASFYDLAQSYGTSGQSIINAVEAVTQGTVSQATIMQQANNAMLLGVADTADEFSTLAKIAQVRGRAMGISMEFAFESIVKGVGRLSPLILDNLGIVINADQTYAKFAATLGVASDQLTEAQKRQALLNALKEEVRNWDSSSVLDGASAWERYGVAVENAKLRIGTFLNTNADVLKAVSGIADAMNFASLSLSAENGSSGDAVKYSAERIKVLTDQIAFLEDAINKIKSGSDLGSAWQRLIGEPEVQAQNVAILKAELASVQAEMGTLNQNLLETGRAFTITGNATMNAQQQMAWMGAQLGLVSDQIDRYAKAADVSKDAAMGWAQGMIESAGSAQAAIPMINQIVVEMEAAAARMNAINGMINSAIGTLGSIGAEAYRNSGYNPEVITMITDTEAALQGAYQALYDSGVEGAALQAVMGQVQDEAFAGLNTINEMATSINKASGSSGGGGVKQLTEEFRNLQGIVSGLFDGAFSDIGTDIADFLPREDAINEPARRIASVMVEGFDSEWVDYFKNTFPILWQEYMGRSGGDVKNAAALLLKDFQNGLRPELIDKEKMKEIAKRMFFVDQQTKALIDEVAKELAGELGISIEEAKGYAGGAGGGGSLAKKLVSPEEVAKIKSMLNFSPKWDWGATGGGNPLIESGKAAGILGDDGKLLVKVKVELDEAGLTALTSKTINQTAKITTIAFDKPGLEKYIGETFGPLSLTAKLVLLASGLDDLKASLMNTSINVSAVPALNYTDWETYKTDAIAMLNGISFSPKIVTEGEEFDMAMSTAKYNIGVGLADKNLMSATATLLNTYLQQSIAEQNMAFRMTGLIIGTYMYSGFSEYNLGLILASELSRQITEAKATFDASAGSAGKMWGNAFLKTVSENVPFELLMILTDLVTPEVMKKVKDANSRGGSEG